MKKTISVLLALVLTVGLFSACSKDGKEETTTAAPAAYTLSYTYAAIMRRRTPVPCGRMRRSPKPLQRAVWPCG